MNNLSKYIFTAIASLLITIPAIVAQSKYTNLFIGTAGDNGQVDPAACVPYGMIRIAPDMEPRSHSGYDYEVTKISGFTINRLSGIGCGGAGGNIRIKPSKVDAELNIVKKSEYATPGYYSVELDNGVKADFTATQNVALERYSFSKGEDPVMTLDVSASFNSVRSCYYELLSENEIAGSVETGNTCDHGSYKLHFYIKLDKKIKALTQTDTKLEFTIADKNKKSIELRIAVSPINTELAKQTCLLLNYTDFDKVKKQASAKWDDILSRIDIKSASNEEKTLFYTSLYRVFLSPANVTSYDRKFLGTDGNTYTADNFTYYSSWSMWDSYRTKFPLITLLDAPTMKDICISLSKLFVYGKADWATNHESTPNVRTEHTITVLLDAYRKGIKFNINDDVYAGLKKEMETLKKERPDQALETCIDYWSMSQIAEILGKTNDAKEFSEKASGLFATTWNKDFKNTDDSFAKMRNSGLYQGTKWQYRWALPQYLDVMAESVGGREALAEQLTTFFAQNLNNQGNEPGIHAPFIFNRLGHPDNAQNTVRDILTKEVTNLYGGQAEYPEPIVSRIFKNTPDGFLPEMDEDDGTMTAWYVFGTIGLFPLTVGEPWYEITSPLYDDITIKLDRDRKLNIKAIGRINKDDLIKRVKFNGKDVPDYRIKHYDLIRGGVLELIYSEK